MGFNRSKICAECPLNVDGYCSSAKMAEAVKDFEYGGEKRYKGKIYNGCGCPVKKKAVSPTSQCPIGKF